MVGQPPKDTPFGMEPNVAAGIAYLFTVIGGVIMLAGGGTNRFVKWAACQAITFFLVCFAINIVLRLLLFMPFFGALYFPIQSLFSIIYLIAWIYLWVNAFQGKEISLPFVGDLTKQLFGSQLA